MPRLNHRGDVAAGVGGEIVSVNKAVVAQPAGGTAWVDDNTVVFGYGPHGDASYGTYACDAQGKNLLRVSDIAPSFNMDGGGGIWAGGQAPKTGAFVYTSTGQRYAGAGLMCVGPEGSVVVNDYATGRNARIYRPDGTVVAIPIVGRAFHMPDPNVIVYGTNDLKAAAWGKSAPKFVSGAAVYSPRGIKLPNGDWWICYYAETGNNLGRVLLHPWDSTSGYVITDGFLAYRHDAVALSQTSVAVTWAGNAGETPDSVVKVIVDLTKPRVEIVPVAPPIVSIGRPTWLAFFNFVPATTPGNAVLNTSDLIVRDAHGLSVAQYAASPNESDPGALDAAIAAAKSKGLPIVAYWTRQAQAIRLPKGADIIGVEAYRDTTESLAAFEARVRAAVARCPKVALVCQCYTSNAKNTADLASLVPVYARIAKDCGNVWGLLVFSGSGRPTGLQDHPDVLPLWQSVAAGIPSAPAEEFMDPWLVKFDESYSKVIARGVGAVARCDIGNGVSVEWQKGADDTIHFAVYKDGTLQNRSSLPRHVDVRG